MYEQGLSYNSINSAKSAIATIHNPCANSSIVSRFLKGVFNMRPALPRYTCTFDVKIVLDYLEQLQLKDLQLKILSNKLCLLLLLLSGQRVQTLQAFDIDNIYLEDTRCTLYINKILKTSKPGRHKSCVQFNCYESVNVCVVCHVKQYLELTTELRGSQKQLFISLNKPHKPVSVDTLSRWTKSMLQESGIDITTFSTRSTRSASTSKGLRWEFPLLKFCLQHPGLMQEHLKPFIINQLLKTLHLT